MANTKSLGVFKSTDEGESQGLSFKDNSSGDLSLSKKKFL